MISHVLAAHRSMLENLPIMGGLWVWNAEFTITVQEGGGDVAKVFVNSYKETQLSDNINCH